MVLCSSLAALPSLEVRMCAVQCDASQLSGQIECTLQSNALPLFTTRPCCRWCSPAVFTTICNTGKAQQCKRRRCGLIRGLSDQATYCLTILDCVSHNLWRSGSGPWCWGDHLCLCLSDHSCRSLVHQPDGVNILCCPAFSVVPLWRTVITLF